MDPYSVHMFTPEVRAEQDRIGMAERFDTMYRHRFTGELDDETRAFIDACQSFYMATVGSGGWPYVQHRGGPRGFLKVLDGETLGFADYTGNKQLISKGNLTTSDKTSLFLMDYARQARLKLIGHATMVSADTDPELAARLATTGAPVERLVTIRLVAMDWNCPKYIPRRFDEDEITALVAPHLASRDAQIAALTEQVRQLGGTPVTPKEPTP